MIEEAAGTRMYENKKASERALLCVCEGPHTEAATPSFRAFGIASTSCFQTPRARFKP